VSALAEAKAKLSDLAGGLIPVWLDAGYMVTPNLMLGVYTQYAIAAGGDAWSGSGTNLRFGVQGQYHVSPAEAINPWLGLGVGYEILKMNSSIGGDVSAEVKGMEFANLQAGLDFRVGSSIALGPFASFSVGQHSSASTSDPYFGSQSGSIDQKALHHWLMFGGRAVLYL
jgi:outer membrane protein W